jgi:hypothetical protein
MGEPVAVPRQEPTGDHRKDRAGGRREERNDGATPASGDRLERTVDADGASCGEVRITAAAGVPAGPVTRAQWRPAETLSEQTSTWQTLFGASMGKKEISASQGEPGISITEFDTFVLFAELSLANGEPQVWLRRSADRQPEQVQASSLIEKLQKWACSRIVIETVASDRRVGCLEATTILAARMARQLGHG